MINISRVSTWLTAFALAATLALPARANTWPLPPSGSRLVGQNQFHVVQDNGGSLEAIAKNTTLVFSRCCRLIPGSILMCRAPVAC